MAEPRHFSRTFQRLGASVQFLHTVATPTLPYVPPSGVYIIDPVSGEFIVDPVSGEKIKEP